MSTKLLPPPSVPLPFSVSSILREMCIKENLYQPFQSQEIVSFSWGEQFFETVKSRLVVTGSHFTVQCDLSSFSDEIRWLDGNISVGFLHNRDEEVELESGREEKPAAYGLYVRSFDDRVTPQTGPAVGYERVLVQSKTKLFGCNLEGKLTNGWNFKAQGARVIKRHTSRNLAKSEYIESSWLAGSPWRITSSDKPASFLIGQLYGLDGDFFGNLDIIGESNGHFRFEGAYTYYLVLKDRSKKLFFLIIQTENELDRDRVRYDLLAMQFVLGCRFDVCTLMGLDDSHAVVSYEEGFLSSGLTALRYTRPAAPTSEGQVLFFKKLSDALQTRNELKIEIPLNSYLHSLTGDLDLSALLLQTSLEATSCWFLESQDKVTKSLVLDPTTWKKWVKKLWPDIKKHAIDDASANTLSGVLKHAPDRHSSGELVCKAFSLLGLAYKKTMENAVQGRPSPNGPNQKLSGRDISVHRRVMAVDGPEFPRDTEQIQLLQIMLVGLVAKIVGYTGEISGLYGFWANDEIKKDLWGSDELENDTRWWRIEDSEWDQVVVRYHTKASK